MYIYIYIYTYRRFRVQEARRKDPLVKRSEWQRWLSVARKNVLIRTSVRTSQKVKIIVHIRVENEREKNTARRMEGKRENKKYRCKTLRECR